MAINKNDILETLKKAGDTVTQTVGELHKSTRLIFDISSKESELADLYRELGKSVYESAKGDSNRLTPEALIAMIDACELELEQLKRKKNAQSASPVCPACGREVSKKAVFCQICGAKISQSQADEKAPAEEPTEAAHAEEIFAQETPLEKPDGSDVAWKPDADSGDDGEPLLQAELG